MSSRTLAASAIAVTLAWPLHSAAAQLVINGNYTNSVALTAGTGQPQTTITINNSQFSQAAGASLNAAAGGTVTLNSTNVIGGLLTQSGTGVLTANNSGSNYLTGVTLAGTFDLATSQGILRVQGGLALGSGVGSSGGFEVNNNSILAFDGNQFLSGTGTIVLGATGGSNRINVEGSNVTLNVGPNVTIRGQNGTIGGENFVGGTSVIANRGLITADVAGGTITLSNSSTVTNTGTLGAANGGRLDIGTSVVNGGGTLSATSGGAVWLQGASITGGTIVTSTGGVLRAANNSGNTLSGVTLNGAIDLATTTSVLQVNGGLTLTAGSTIDVNQNSILALAAGQTIGGTGEIRLGTTGSSNRISVEGAGMLTIGPNVTIRGHSGTIGGEVYVAGAATITNNGSILADVSGGTISLNESPIINNGTLGAANGGTLVLNSNVTGNAGSQISAGAGSVVLQNGVTVSGVINTAGTGSFRAANNGNNFLSAATLTGSLDLATATGIERVTGGLTFGNGTVGSTGTISLNNNSILTFEGTQTIGGTGTIILGSTGASNRIALDGAGVTTIGSGVTIRGQNGSIGGQIYVGGAQSLVNNGTIAADVSGGTISIDESPVTNNGTLAARNGGTLVLNSNVTGNAGSQIEAGAGSVVLQNGVTVSGAINTTGTGSFRAANNGNNFLNAASLNGSLDLATATGIERVTGGLTFGNGTAGSSGTINLNNNSVLTFEGTQTVGGTGAIVLGNTGPSNRVVLDGVGVTTLGSGVTIRGQNGTIGNQLYVGGTQSLVNNGTIAADVATGVVTITESDVTNNGTLAALNGGTLVLNSNVAGGTGSQFATDASSYISQNGVTLSGLVNVTGGGSLRATNNGNNFLDAATLGGRLDLATSTGIERVTDGLTLGVGTNAGRIDINNNSILTFEGTQTIGGTGEIVFGSTGASNRIILDGGGTTTIGPNVTISGTNGTIGNQLFVGGTQTLVNTGTINSNGGGLITITESDITNNGLLRAQNGVLTVQTPLTGTGTLQVDAAGTVNLTGGTSVSQGTLAIGATGATVNNGTRNITLSADYTNASAGSGNSFNRRAGITGSGQVLAGGDVSQEIAGANVTNGTTTTATLTIGNTRVGTGTTYTYTIDNNGTTGPALRGAIQTSVNGANISDSRLSGSGVTAGLYGPAPVGGSSAPYEVTFTTNTAGAIAPLSGQTVNLRSSYENIADQKLNVVVGSGAGAYVVAQGQLDTPALNFGTVQVGQVVTQNLSFTNAATGPAGYVEDLNVAFGGTSGTGASRISGTGAVNGLAAGATGGGMAVSVNTSSAGTVNGSIAITYTSAGAVNGVSNGLGTLGVGGTSYGVSGLITATVIDQAQPVINTPTINLGNVRINTASPTAAVSVTNQSTGASGQAALNASIAGTPPVTASGSFSLLNPGATNSSSLSVGINTATAGAVSGTATVSFVSDASNVGGCAPNCQVALPSQNVNVSGTVYRLANPTGAPTSVTHAARVGGTATQAISVTNSSPDVYTESLNASFSGAAPAGFTTSGSVNALAAQGTSNALTVGLNTATAGTYSGTATVNAVSTGAGTTGAADVAVGSTNLTLNGRVYTAAVGQVAPTIDFGIVHVGDVVSRGITVTNGAAVTALNDVLVASASGGSPNFAASGSIGGLAAGTSNNSSLQVALNTSTNGQFTGTAAVALASRNPDLADLSLGTANVALVGQVNNYAQGAFAKTGGAGAFSMTGANAYLLDFGTIMMGAGATTANLAVDNVATGFADLLNGSFLTSGTGFSFFGFNAFSNLAAGSRLGGLGITFDASNLGAFTGSVTLNDFGTNASGYMGALDPITLTVRGTVTGTVSAVPEPSTWTMVGAGLVGVGVLVRRRRRGASDVTPVAG